jgi:hypothetical protein
MSGLPHFNELEAVGSVPLGQERRVWLLCLASPTALVGEVLAGDLTKGAMTGATIVVPDLASSR